MYRLILFLIGVLIGLLFMCSCSCERMAKRVERKCGKNAFVDTLKVTVSDTIPGFRKDTLFAHSADTIYLKEGETVVKYFYNTIDKTNYLSLNKKPEIRYKVISVPYEKIKIEYDWFEENKWYLLVCSLGLIGLFIAIPRLLPKK
jgi:hypothetical protein